jgi:hypothetical protein
MEDQKRRQVEYHEREHYCAWQPREVDNSNPLIAWLNGYRLRRMVEMIGVPLAGKTVLSDARRYFSIAMPRPDPAGNQPYPYRILTGKPGRYLMKVFFQCAHFLGGRWGNSLILVARKKPLEQRMGSTPGSARFQRAKPLC